MARHLLLFDFNPNGLNLPSQSLPRKTRSDDSPDTISIGAPRNGGSMKTNGLRIPSIWAICTAVFTLTPVVATAGGLLGDAINLIAPGAGTQLDDAHRRIKEAIPHTKRLKRAQARPLTKHSYRRTHLSFNNLLQAQGTMRCRMGCSLSHPIFDKI